jgi:hypothetical protein
MRTWCIAPCTSCPWPASICCSSKTSAISCPAAFDLGQHLNVTLPGVTEGDDKPAKYPVIFRASDLVVLTKTDLLDVMDDFADSCCVGIAGARRRYADGTHGSAARSGDRPWLEWLEQQLARPRIHSGRSAVAHGRCSARRMRHAWLFLRGSSHCSAISGSRPSGRDSQPRIERTDR